MRGFLATLTLVLALAGPASPALGQGTPFSPLPPAPAPAPAPSSPANSSSSDGGGLAGWQSTMIYLGGAILLAGIGVAIVLDAREKARRAGGSHGVPAEPVRRDPRKERAKHETRRKQKAARAQRRRNR